MAKTTVKIAVLCILFAALSAVINIGSQMVLIWAYKAPFAIEVHILVGAAAGLAMHYFLEKRYIFVFTSKNLAHDGKLLFFYSAIGVITTFIYWNIEHAIHLIYDTDLIHYVGVVVGLATGYYIKFQLDKKHDFVNSPSEVL